MAHSQDRAAHRPLKGSNTAAIVIIAIAVVAAAAGAGAYFVITRDTWEADNIAKIKAGSSPAEAFVSAGVFKDAGPSACGGFESKCLRLPK
ncbi:MAG: hypothetical protein HZA50_08390 [Planctomycetes bacterium]|nr:hypothetical protein [Planctomycetota bacterium]